MILDVALELIRMGFAPVPIPFRGKNPGAVCGKDWIKLRITEQTAPKYFNGTPSNIGVILGAPSGELVDIDLDCAPAIELAPRLLPATRTFGRASKPASHWIYQTDDAGRIRQFQGADGGMIVEYRANGGQTVFPGSVHEGGENIDWTDNTPVTKLAADKLRRAVAQLATAVLLVQSGVSADEAVTLVQSDTPNLSAVIEGPALARASSWLGLSVPAPEPPRPTNSDAGNVFERARAYIRACSDSISGQGGHKQTLWVAICLKRGFQLSDPDTMALLREYSANQCKPPWCQRDLDHKLASAKSANRIQHPEGWLLNAEPPRRSRQSWHDDSDEPDPELPPNFDPETGELLEPDLDSEPEERPKRPRPGFNLTDLGNAERLVAKYGDRIRYCTPRKRWLGWDGKRWRWDETGFVHRLAKRTVRAIYGEAAEASDDGLRSDLVKHGQKSEGAERINAMIKLASTEEGVAVLPEDLDADPWLFNVANGTIDLRTGKLRRHDRRDFITKLSPVAYDPDARHPVWEQFLSDVTGDDDDLEAFLRRVAGWSIAGVCDEKKFVFVYGPPDTGKSTYLDAIGSTLGEYQVSTDFETWTVQTNSGGNRGDLVRLAGSRMVTSVEVRAGAKFDEALIKRVTGGDPLTYAAKYEAEITFRPTFTLLLAANDAPKLRDDDAGAWKRVLRVPFPHPIPVEKKSPNVRRALVDPEDAGPAILAWAVRGCLEWQQEGLGSCSVVDESTAAYQREMDRIASFFETRCEFGEGLRVSRKEFRETYLQWCKENGVRQPLKATEIAQRIRSLGATEAKTRGVRSWVGVTIVDEEPEWTQ